MRTRKPNGYWTKERCAAEAQKYDTRAAFKSGNPSAYAAAQRRGLLDEICGHMEARFRWTDEMLVEAAAEFKTRKAFKSGNLGAYLAARKRGIFDEICRRMVAQRTDWTHKKMPLRCNTAAGKQEIEMRTQKPRGYWTKERCAAEAQKYTTRVAFQRGNNGAYLAAYRRGLLDEVCSHMEAQLTAWTDEKLAEAAAEYTSRKAFERGNPNAYQAAQKRGLLDKVCSHMEAQRTDWTDEMIAAEAQKYTTRVAFQRGNRNAYSTAHRRGLLDEVCSHMEAQYTYWTDEMIADAALKFETRKAFHLGSRGAYKAAQKRGLLDKVCSHMEVQRTDWTDEMIADAALKFETRSAFERGNPKAYGTARRHGLLDRVCSHMEDGDTASDNDTIYIWKALNVFFMGHQVYKVGVTSERRGMQRVKEGARAGGMEYELIRLVNVNGKATDSEDLILKTLGRDPQFTGFNGSEEYRAMTPKELAEAVDLIDSEEI